MTKLIVQTDNQWTKKKIKSALETEKKILEKAIERVADKLKDFEGKYGQLEKESLHGRIDDMELLEWEGEIETVEKLREQVKSFEEITFEYR